MEAHLEVAGLLGTHGRTDGPALVLNAFVSVLCGKGVSVGFSDFGRSVVTAFLGMLGHVYTPPLCVVCCLGSWNQCPMNFGKCVRSSVNK